MRIRSSEGQAALTGRTPDFDTADASPIDRGGLLPPDDSRLSGYARAAFDPHDPVSRTARSIRLSISSAAGATEAIRSVAVLNIDAAFEASLLAANLAITYAQSGISTVIVDASADDPRQHELLGVDRGEGLIALLGGEVDARSVVEATAVRDLFVLPAGPADKARSILLDDERFHRRVMPLLDSLGMMIVDVGPVADDPPALCQTVDAAVIIVRRNRTAIAAIQHLVGRLEDMGTRVVGTLIVD